jgi:hypothetical protein
VQHPQKIAAPDLLDVGLGVIAAHQLRGDIAGAGFIFEADDARPVVEVRTYAYVVDADAPGDVLDVIDGAAAPASCRWTTR